MALAIDTTDGRGFSNEARGELLPKKSKVMLYLLFITRQKQFNQLYITNKTHFRGVLCGFEAYKTRLAYSVTIRISAQNNFMLLLKLDRC